MNLPASHLAQLDALALRWSLDAPRPPWITAACNAIVDRHCHLICTPDGAPYLLRMWLTTPTRNFGEWESGNSSLLHWILQPDADRHLHDHPWRFSTQILAGSYLEETEEGATLWDTGSIHTVHLGTPHRIASLGNGPGDLLTGDGGVWSRLLTGPRERPWGFYVGGQWIDHAAYLAPTLDPVRARPSSSPDASASGFAVRCE